jgi:hypothetical protein
MNEEDGDYGGSAPMNQEDGDYGGTEEAKFWRSPGKILKEEETSPKTPKTSENASIVIHFPF